MALRSGGSIESEDTVVCIRVDTANLTQLHLFKHDGTYLKFEKMTVSDMH